MDLGTGWNLPLAVTRKIALLDYLADNHSESRFTPLPSGTEESGSEGHKLAALDLRSFQASGWVELAEDFGGGADALLLGPGWTFIEDLRAKRQDRLRRYQAARDSVLHWLHNDDITGGGYSLGVKGFRTTPYGLYYGEPFSDDEVAKAIRWLVELGFISSQGSGVGGQVLRVKITAKGTAMAESGLSVNDREPVPAASMITNTHVVGNHNTFQVSSPGASIEVSTTITDDHRRQSLHLAEAIEQAQSAFSPEAAEVARELREAVAPGQDEPSVVRQALEKAKATLVTGSADLLGKAILGGFAGLLGHYGIPA